MAVEQMQKAAVSVITYSQLSHLSDEHLLEQLQLGCNDALAILFDRYNRLIMSIALRILRDSGEAEDLMQSVFLEIFRAAAQFDRNKGTAKVWILQYAYHRSFNRRQYLNLRGNYDAPQDLDCVSLASALPYSRTLDALELKRMLEESMSRLSSVQRIIFELVFYDGLTMREIAEKTGRSFDSVRHQYYRGLETLRSVWCEQTSEAGVPILLKERLC